MTMANPKNDIYYAAALIEFVSRKTKNHRADVCKALGVEGIRLHYKLAETSHCLSFEEVSDEVIEDFGIQPGNFSPELQIENPPSFLAIGKNYADLVEDSQPDPARYPDELYAIMCSKISDWMTDYRSAFYYSPRDYFRLEYEELKEGEVQAQ